MPRFSLLRLPLLLGLSLAAQAGDFALHSPDFAPDGSLKKAQVYQGFGCEGGNTSPALTWENAPEGTKSFALTVYDPDAPTGSGWWHWVIYNLPPAISSLPAGAGDPSRNLAPTGATQAITDYGTRGFGGACPPVGDKPHRYVFTLHALKVESLDLPANASGAMVGFNIHMNSLGSASVTATYGR